MEANWAIVNNDMIVIGLYEGDISYLDISEYENYGGEVKYSSPFEYRGTPSIGSVWSNELDKFQ
jgi:hypothetical protein